MDDYRHLLKNTHVVAMGKLLDEESNYRDDQIVSVAGVVQSVKMKTTRNNSMMAYVTVEDDTASLEMLAFSNVLNEYGGYLRENAPVVITGRLSLRDDKEPQIVINRARPISDYTQGVEAVRETAPRELEARQLQTIYLRLPTENGSLFSQVRDILKQFPGNHNAVVYFADTKQRRGTHCTADKALLSKLCSVLGEENVVLK